MHPRTLLRSLVFCISFLWFGGAHAAGMGVDEARHFLNRVGFGATPEEIVEFSRLTREQAITRVLTPATTRAQVPVPADAGSYVPASELRAMRAKGPDGAREVQRERTRRGLLLKGWWVEEMLAADTPA